MLEPCQVLKRMPSHIWGLTHPFCCVRGSCPQELCPSVWKVQVGRYNLETGMGPLNQRCTCISPESEIRTNGSSLKLPFLVDFMEEGSSKISREWQENIRTNKGRKRLLRKVMQEQEHKERTYRCWLPCTWGDGLPSHTPAHWKCWRLPIPWNRSSQQGGSSLWGPLGSTVGNLDKAVRSLSQAPASWSEHLLP